MRTFGLIAMLALCGPVMSGAQAADIRVAKASEVALPKNGFQRTGVMYISPSNSDIFIRLDGRIEPGDAKRLKSLIDRARAAADGHSYVRLLLDSSGGNYKEAIRMAEANRLTTVVAKGAECLGACAILFLSGRQLGGDGESPPDRYAHSSARINFAVSNFNAPETGSSKALRDAFDSAVELTVFLLRKRLDWNLPNRFFLGLVDKSIAWQSVAKETKIHVID